MATPKGTQTSPVAFLDGPTDARTCRTVIRTGALWRMSDFDSAGDAMAPEWPGTSAPETSRQMLPITVVAATRLNQTDFITHSALGRSLAKTYPHFKLNTMIFLDNRQGLGTCYNIAISRIENDNEIIIFMHDDVFIVDFFWIDKILTGIKLFDVLGVAGNRRRVPRQPNWCFIEDNGTWDERSNLSGIVGHGNGFPCDLSIYGEVTKSCKLLDGLFLAARKKTFGDNGISFDEQFKFHFYDMDICRQFEQKNVSMGTIPLGLIHASQGAFGSPEWRASYQAYLAKWKD